jgi:alginate O-acetyltransferase complex protein AlgI
MLFNSFVFLFFLLPLALLFYFGLNAREHFTLAKLSLVGASLVFYSWSNVKLLPVILISAACNFCIGTLLIRAPQGSPRRKALLVLGIATNLLALVYFKYLNFVIANVEQFLRNPIDFTPIVLPLGISFFTITQITFLVDAYEGMVEEKSPVDYALFVTFFPHLIAGPILHHSDMMPQFADPEKKRPNAANFSLGLYIFGIGLAKKVLLADQFAVWADQGFDSSAHIPLVQSWLASLSYVFQLGFDFSGYTDMAIGSAKLFNLDLPINFRSPYKSRSVIEYWQRWHISLSRFITSYLYTPILRAFSRITFLNAMIATLVSMIIAGIWHGANWTYFLFGAYYGIALVINHLFRRRSFKLPAALSWLITFVVINVGEVIFRAKDLGNARDVLSGMLGLHGLGFTGCGPGSCFSLLAQNWMALALAMVGVVVVFFCRNTETLQAQFKPTPGNALLTVFFLVLGIINMKHASKFIYFNF